MNITLFNLTFAGYLLACIFYFIHSVFKSKGGGIIATALLAIGFIFNTLLLIHRWQEAQHLPVIGLYETLVFALWSVILVYLILEKIYKFKFIGIPITLLAVSILGWTSILDKSIQPLLPALKSNWIAIHVISYFTGYSCLAVSFICSLTYILGANSTGRVRGFVGSRTQEPANSRTQELKNSPTQEPASNLDNLSYGLVRLAFPFLTIGLTTGAVWAKTAWGRYWSWDPKETWALITWLIYAAYLHLRLLKNWQGQRAAILNILGFLCVLFTFLGVNYLMKGLHSYL